MRNKRSWKKLTALVMGTILIVSSSAAGVKAEELKETAAAEASAEADGTQIDMTEAVSQSEIPVYEDGILVQSNKIYYGQFDEQQQGILKLQDAKLKYYVDGKFQSAFSGRLSGDSDYSSKERNEVSFYVKNGIVDTGFQGIVTMYNTDYAATEGTHFYVVNGIISDSAFESNPDDPSNSMCSNATGLSIQNTADGISVGYNPNTYGDDCGFFIYRLCHETGEFVFYAKLDGSSTGFVDRKVESNHTYTYYIWTYSFYNIFNGGGYGCGFVDLSIVYGENDTGKVNTFENFTLPEDSATADIEWNLSDDGILTISGNGDMPDYNKSEAPWSSKKNDIKSVIVGEGITTVGEAAFYECRNLESVVIASSVEGIKSGAFYNCASLQTVELGEGLRMINDNAFEGTTSLTDIRLPASLGRISPAAFWNSGLQRYEIAEESVYTVQDGVLFNNTGTILLSYPCGLEKQSYRIPSAVTVIDKYAFQYAAVKSVDIPDSVKVIKKSAFTYSSLESLSIPNSVTEVEDFALYNCTALKELQLGSGLKSLSYRFAEGCSSLEKLVLDEGLEEIDMRAFGYCASLKTLILPSSVEKIDGEAFGLCTSLESVIFNEGLKRIESRAFYGTALFSVDLPASLIYIESYAFPEKCSLNFSEDSKLSDFGGYYQRVYEAQIEAEYNYDMAFQVLEQVNQKREENGLGILKMDEDLLDAAMLRAAEISIYFSHDRPSGLSCYSVNGKVVAENIAAGNRTAVSVMDSWMNSAGHRGNILGADHVGIGIGCVKVNGTYYWVQLFSWSEVNTEADGNNRQNSSEVTTVLFDMDSDAGKGFSVSVNDSKIKKGDKTNILTRFYNGYRYTQLYSESISFSSSDPSVVTVSPEGEVTGVAKGEAEVTACLTKDPKIYGTVTITVEDISSAGELPDLDEVSTEGDNKPSSGGAAKQSIANAKVTLSQTGYSYDGKAKKPTVKSVKLGKATLKSGTDYGIVVSYKNNRNIGKATATVELTGKGNYTGKASIDVKFAISAKKGTSFTVGSYKYKITDSRTVAFSGLKSANTKIVKIPKTVKIGGKSFKVTSIADKALKNAKVTSITISENITKIGGNAFLGCKKLLKVTIKSSKLKTVGRNAFKGIKSNAKIKVPAKKLSAYKKLLRDKGMGSGVKITK